MSKKELNIKWIVNTFLDNFLKGVFLIFYWRHLAERRMNPMVIKPNGMQILFSKFDSNWITEVRIIAN